MTDDTYVSGATPTTANGSSTALVVQGSTTGKPSYTYIRFDLLTLGAIQAAEVQKATLRLYVTAVSASGGFDVVELTSPTGWLESTLTYSTSGASSPTGSALATNVQVPYPAGKSQYIVLDVTQAVKDWLNNPSANNGLVLKPHDSNISVSFSSKEDTTFSHDPSLVVVVTPGFGPNLGVSTFKSRTGAVTPADQDYTFGMIDAGQNTRALVIGPGGSLSVSGGGTIAATSVPGAGVSGDITGKAASINGSIAESQVTNLSADLNGKVSSTGSYSDPSWITSLSGAKITGNITGNAASITGSISGGQVSSAVANAVHASSADNATNAANAAGLTGSIFESQVTGLSLDLSSKVPQSAVAAANGVASLDGSSKVPISQLPSLSGNYVDLSSDQNVAGNKTFNGNTAMNQSAAGKNVLSAKRASDSTLTGDFLNFTKTDGTTSLFEVDVTGTLKTGTVPYASLSGAPASLPPSGAAGGDLTGSYPNPSLTATGTAGTYTKVTTDSKGRVTAGGVLSAGDIPNLSATYDVAGAATTAQTNAQNFATNAANAAQANAESFATNAANTAAAGAVVIAEGYSDTQLSGAVSTINTSLAGKAAKGANSDITSLSALNSVSAAQSVAGQNVLSAKRADDNNATGDFLNFTKTDGTTSVFEVDVTGTLKTGTVPYANLSGAPVSLPPSGTAGGDLSGSYPNPTVFKLNGQPASYYATAQSVSDEAAARAAGDASTLTSANTYTDTAAGNTLSSAKTYTDTTAASTLTSAKSYTDSSAVTTLNSAKTYTDSSVAIEAGLRVAGDAASVSTANSYTDNAVATINSSLAGKAAKGANSDITSLSALNSVSAAQSAAGQNVLSAKRASDSTLTGDFLNFTKTDGTTSLFEVDVTGTLKTGTVPYANLSGAPASLPPSGTAGGDLTGSYPNPSLAATGTAGTYTKVTTDSKGRITSGGTLSTGDIPNISESQVTNLTTDLAAKESTANKNQANGYAGLDGGSKIAVSQIPNLSGTYVDLTSSQTIGGTKTFSNPIAGSVTGSAASVTGNVAGSQITGNITGNAASITGSITESQVTGLTTDLANKAPLASPNFSGIPTAPTPAPADSSTNIATTAFVKAQGYVTSTSAPVTSVFGRAGAVAAQAGDYSFDKIAGGSNTNALTIGNGGSLAPTGTGTVTANVLVAATYTNVLNLNNAGNSFTGTYSGNGSALTNLNASNLSSGTIPGARIAPALISAVTTSAVGPSAGTTATATASCPGSAAVLGGGAQVTNTSGSPDSTVMTQSFPASTSSWTAVGVVTKNLTGANTMTVKAWVVCSGS